MCARARVKAHVRRCEYILFHRVLTLRIAITAFSRAGLCSLLAKWLVNCLHCGKFSGGKMLYSFPGLMDVVLPLTDTRMGRYPWKQYLHVHLTGKWSRRKPKMKRQTR